MSRKLGIAWQGSPRFRDRPLFRLLVALAALLTLTLAGTLGYVLIEQADWFDALYMTVITLSTIGYGEIFPLSHAGRAFTIVLIVTGVGTVAYLLTSMGQVFAMDVFARLTAGNSMQKQIDRTTQHIIVCGHGRFGQILVEELMHGEVPIVIIERDPLKQAELEKRGLAFVIGNATSDEVLASAGLARAQVIVAATNSDPDNVFITLAAREQRRDIRIHARGESSESIRRLKQAGADFVLSPYQMGGLSLAASVMRPAVAQFLQIARPHTAHPVDLEEIRVMAQARLLGRTLSAIEQECPRLRIVALMRADRSELIPDPNLRIEVGDFLVVIGERKSLEQLATLAST
jgi:voltage-gated potassium channel